MKILKIHIKAIALFLLVLIMLQSCTVYKSAPTTLDEASRTNEKVRVYKKDGEKVKYSKIELFNNGHYYGVESSRGLFNNVLINEDEIDKLQLRDKTASTILTIGLPVLIVGLVIGGIAFAWDRGGGLGSR